MATVIRYTLIPVGLALGLVCVPALKANFDVALFIIYPVIYLIGFCLVLPLKPEGLIRAVTPKKCPPGPLRKYAQLCCALYNNNTLLRPQ